MRETWVKLHSLSSAARVAADGRVQRQTSSISEISLTTDASHNPRASVCLCSCRNDVDTLLVEHLDQVYRVIMYVCVLMYVHTHTHTCRKEV